MKKNSKGTKCYTFSWLQKKKSYNSQHFHDTAYCCDCSSFYQEAKFISPCLESGLDLCLVWLIKCGRCDNLLVSRIGLKKPSWSGWFCCQAAIGTHLSLPAGGWDTGHLVAHIVLADSHPTLRSESSNLTSTWLQMYWYPTGHQKNHVGELRPNCQPQTHELNDCCFNPLTFGKVYYATKPKWGIPPLTSV